MDGWMVRIISVIVAPLSSLLNLSSENSRLDGTYNALSDNKVKQAFNLLLLFLINTQLINVHKLKNTRRQLRLSRYKIVITVFFRLSALGAYYIFGP